MVVKSSYIPDRGDIVWVNFSPQRGREQANKRPAVVISPKIYNNKSNLVLLCPITTKIKGYPFEVNIGGNTIDGVALSDQVRSLDWRARKIRFVEKIHVSKCNEIADKLIALVSDS